MSTPRLLLVDEEDIRIIEQRFRDASTGDRLRIYPGAVGIHYYDSWEEVGDGDYRDVAFLAYDTLVLTWQANVGGGLVDDINAHAALIRAMKGMTFAVSDTQTVIIGEGKSGSPGHDKAPQGT